ncbi:MAG: FAD binding domain-containing protein [Spirochaetaceae bacterium]|jgi:CO/xanthine dehydrogenase FAD-binding subunit|nr:FAD binding domain-containing protein [Spirochaetaceae bacterium]
MDAALNQVWFPANFQELFTIWKQYPDALPFAGGTQFLRGQARHVPVFPRNVLSLSRLEELHRITRTERHLEIGAMVKLNELINLGKVVPEVLTRCLVGIAGPKIRNLATIGGNICTPSGRLDAAAPMIALDAHYEVRRATAARWIASSRFYSPEGALSLGEQELLTRIRIPLEEWTYSAYTKYASPGTRVGSEVMVLILRNQKNLLTNIRMVFVGDRIIHDKNSEALLMGKRLPLERKQVGMVVDYWRTRLHSIYQKPDLLQDRLLNFIESSLLPLAN